MRSPFAKHDRFFSETGSREEPVYQVEFDKKGVKSLKITGKRNVYDEIQAQRESCDLQIILKRYLNGDESVLNQRVPLYIDNTQLPSNMAEWFNLVESTKSYFYSLPSDVRAQFNNSVEQFLVGASDAGFNVSNVDSSNVDKVESEVKDNE